jgi:hypothetical protein
MKSPLPSKPAPAWAKVDQAPNPSPQPLADLNIGAQQRAKPPVEARKRPAPLSANPFARKSARM